MAVTVVATLAVAAVVAVAAVAAARKAELQSAPAHLSPSLPLCLFIKPLSTVPAMYLSEPVNPLCRFLCLDTFLYTN